MKRNIEERLFVISQISDLRILGKGVLKATLEGECEGVEAIFKECLFLPYEDLWLATKDNLWLNASKKSDFNITDGQIIFLPVLHVENFEDLEDSIRLSFLKDKKIYEIISVSNSQLIVRNTANDVFFVESQYYLEYPTSFFLFSIPGEYTLDEEFYEEDDECIYEDYEEDDDEEDYD